MPSYTVFFNGYVPSSIRWSRRQIGAMRAALRLFVIALVAHLAVTGPAMAASVNWGAYDPESRLASVSSKSFDHVFVSWTDIDYPALGKALATSAVAGRQFLITVEPVPIRGERGEVTFCWRSSPVSTMAFSTPSASFLPRLPHQSCSVGAMRWMTIWAGTRGRDRTRPRSRTPSPMWRCAAVRKLPIFGWYGPIKGLPNATQYYPGNGAVDVVGIANIPARRGGFKAATAIISLRRSAKRLDRS